MRRIITLLFMGILLAACVKNNIPDIPPVHENFNWKTTTTIALDIPVSSPVSVKSDVAEYASTVNVYTSPLYSQNSLVASGAAFTGKPFQTVVDLAKGQKELFIKTISPDGLITLSTYDVVGSKAVKSTVRTTAVKAQMPEPNVPKPPTMLGAVTLNNASDLATVQSGKTQYDIPEGKSFSVSSTPVLSSQGVVNTLYVKGKLTITSSIQLSYSSLVVLSGGEVIFKGGIDLGWTQQRILAIYVAQGGKLSVAQGIRTGVSVNIVNEGETILKGACDFTNGLLLYNTGTLKMDDDLILSNGSVCHNTGKMEVEGLSIRNNSAFYNYGGNQKNAMLKAEDMEMTNNEGYFYQHGFVEIQEEFNVRGKVDNYGRMECDVLKNGDRALFYGYAGSLLKTVYLSSVTNCTFYLAPQSIFFIYQNGNGNGNTNNWNVKFINQVADGKDYALILWGVNDKKPDNTIINGKDEISFTGNIENYCPKKNKSQNTKYTEDLCTNYAFWGGRTHSIPESDYNEGLGGAGGKDPVDKDKDGVPEGEDVDDNDPTVTHVSYFPSAGGWGSYFFEDLWPNVGDYDMNDIVLDFRIAYFTKGAPTTGNPVVYMDVVWKLRAVGSQLQLAMGIQLDKITPVQVAALDTNHDKLGQFPIDNKGGKGLESGQSKAVFALFNNPAELFGVSTGINVFRGADKMTPVEKKTRIRFISGGVAKNDLSMAHINPFIVVASKENPQERGREIHLSTSEATDKINTAYYHQGFTSKNNPYKATSGMVWGYMVPISFRYPAEMTTVTKAYPNFKKWYESSGAEHEDWYDPAISGNVIEEYLYEPKNAVN